MENTLTKIALEYALSNLDQNELDALIQNELHDDEKIELLISLPDNRIKDILKILGFKNDFLKTI
jgi:hypothetical protein